MTVSSKEVVDEKTGSGERIFTGAVRGLNEGVTNLMAEKLSGKMYDMKDIYGLETSAARQIANLIGEDSLFEGYLFNPQLVADKFDKMGGENSYSHFVYCLDEYQRLNIICNDMEKIKKEAHKSGNDKLYSTTLQEQIIVEQSRNRLSREVNSILNRLNSKNRMQNYMQKRNSQKGV